jgi:hypothetical protein
MNYVFIPLKINHLCIDMSTDVVIYEAQERGEPLDLAAALGFQCSHGLGYHGWSNDAAGKVGWVLRGALWAPIRSMCTATASVSALFVVPLVGLRGRGRRGSTRERGGGGLGRVDKPTHRVG